MGGPGSGRRKVIDLPRPAEIDRLLPQPPDYLKDLAKQKWNEIIRENTAGKLFDQGYLTLLETFCTVYADWRKNLRWRDELRKSEESFSQLMALGREIASQLRIIASLSVKLGLNRSDPKARRGIDALIPLEARGDAANRLDEDPLA